MSIEGIDKNIKKLKMQGLPSSIGPDKGGHWEIIKTTNKRTIQKKDNYETNTK